MKMRGHVRKPRPPGRAPSPPAVQTARDEEAAALLRRSVAAPRTVRPADLLRLQRSIGNRAVGRLLVQRTIQNDVQSLQQDLQATDDPLLTSILTEVLAAHAQQNVTAAYGPSGFSSHVDVDRNDNDARQYDVVIDDQRVPDDDKRQAVLVHELMHVVADQKYAFNRNQREETINAIEVPGANNPAAALRPQLQYIRQLMEHLVAVIASERGVLGGATADYLTSRAGRTLGSVAQEFDTVVSELYYYAHKIGMSPATKTFKELRALARAAHLSRNLQQELRDTYSAPGSFRELARHSACFITTACCRARGLPDDCEELTVLRAFRDGWMARLEGGPEMIGRYYRMAPAIVAAIEARPDPAAVWNGVYATVRHAVRLVRAGENRAALQVYRSAVLRLRDEHCPHLGEGGDDSAGGGAGEADGTAAAPRAAAALAR